MPIIDQQTKSEIEFDIQRIKAIIGSGILSQERADDPLFQSALTEMLIRVRDLLAKSINHASRISFVDDVKVNGKVTDVTSLITFIRDADCHVDSKKHDHDRMQARISYNRIFGKGCLGKFGNVVLEADYEDDIAFLFGPQRLYLKRHLIRAYEEAVTQLQPLL